MYNYNYIVYFEILSFSGLYTYNTKQDLLKNWPIDDFQVKKNIKRNEMKIYRKHKKNRIYFPVNIYDFYNIKKEELKNV